MTALARRSCLSVPGGSERMLAKARDAAADEIVIDLEDSVAADAKDAARATVVAAVSEGGWRAQSVAVRINAPGTPWFEADVADLVRDGGAALRCLVVPKVERAADVVAVAQRLEETPVGLELLIETAAGLSRACEIAQASDRAQSLIVGYADLAASLGRPPIAAGERPGDRWGPVLHEVLVAARSAGIQAIDGPFFDIADLEGCRAWARAVRGLGFDGKWALHPTQVEPLNAAFSPSAAEVEAASALIAALEAGEAQGRGAVLHDGEMIDEAGRKHALGVLARGAAGERSA